MDVSSERPDTPMRPSVAGLGAAGLSGAVALLYIALIIKGDVGASGDEGRVAVFAAVLVTLPVCAALGALRPSSSPGVTLLAVAAVGMLVMGVLGAMSIGLPLLVGSGLAWVAVLRSARGRSGVARSDGKRV